MSETFACTYPECPFVNADQDAARAHSDENPSHFVAWGLKADPAVAAAEVQPDPPPEESSYMPPEPAPEPDPAPDPEPAPEEEP
jgi:hypothetical protein